MKTNLYNYFYYTRTERNGALLLCLLCAACFILPQFFKITIKQKESPDFKAQFAHFETIEKNSEYTNTHSTNTAITLFAFNPNTVTKEDLVILGLSPKLAQTIVNYRNKGGQFRREEDLLRMYGMQEADYERLKPYIQLHSAPKFDYASKHPSERKPALLFPFNPNTISKEEFIKLGLPKNTAAMIVKYREKGGTFRKKEDLKKIYGLDEKDYERLASYIQIETASVPSEQKPTATTITTGFKSPDSKITEFKHTMIDINQADAAGWQTLRGIGATYAKRITNFREKLGGFSSVEQVKETFGLPDSTFQSIKTQLQTSAVFRTIALNTATVQELDAHPYIDARKAAAIVSYREQHGAFKSVDDLKQLKSLDADWLEKAKPYFRLD